MKTVNWKTPMNKAQRKAASTPVEASEIEPGDCFKRTWPEDGDTHIRINPASMQFWGHDEEYVWGLNIKTGGIWKLEPTIRVLPVRASAILAEPE